MAAPDIETTTEANLRRHVSYYLTAGWSIIPVGRNKRPVLDVWQGYAIARADADEWEAWFTDYPGSGVAAILGGCETEMGLQLVNADADCPEQLAWLAAQSPQPRTPTVKTARGIRPFYLAPAGLKHTDAKGEVPAFLAGTHLSILPPSVHPTGCLYEWLPGLAPWDVEIAELPEWGTRVMGAKKPTRPRTNTGKGGTTRGRAYGQAALRREAEELAAMLPDTGRNTRLNRAAFALGQLVAGGELDESDVRAALADACHRNGYIKDDGKRAFDSTFASGMSRGKEEPRTAPEADEFTDEQAAALAAAYGPTLSPSPSVETVEPPAQNRQRRWSGSDLLKQEFPDPEWVIPGLLAEGLIVLAGRPKLGKSWFALQVAFAKACGGVVVGERLDPGRVCYCALEDGPRRLQDRMRQQRWTPEAADATEFITSLTVDELEKLLAAEQFSLCVIDTFARLIANSKGGSKLDHDGQGDMTAAWGRLQELSQTTATSLLVLEHHNQSFSGDVVSDILGSTAKGAVPDTVAGLYRKRGEVEAKLIATGRDIEEKIIPVTFHGESGTWQPADAPGGIDLKHAPGIMRLLADGPGTISGLAKQLQASKNAVSYTLKELVNAGQVRIDEHQCYCVVE